jgi:predicted metal-binding protein
MESVHCQMVPMPSADKDARLDKLPAIALSLGADEARIIDIEKVVVDKRVRLKCSVPICASYARNLMCPPNVISVEEFANTLSLYSKALILQVQADYDSTDKSESHLGRRICEELEESTKTREWQLKLHRVVNQLEAIAFKEGFRFAAGLIGGDCSLCPECVMPHSGESCRRPFEARPSMEAMGIDVLKTCENAGLPLSLSSKKKVRWTGLVLLH